MKKETVNKIEESWEEMPLPYADQNTHMALPEKVNVTNGVPASEVDSLIDRVISQIDYNIDPNIADQIKRVLRMPNILGQTELMKFDDAKYIHLLVILMNSHPLSIVHTNLPLGFPTKLENVRYAFHLSLPLKVQVPLANGFQKFFTFKRSVIALLIEPPVYNDVITRNKFATEAEHFAHWLKRKGAECPQIAAFERICRDYDVQLVTEAYSEHLVDGIYKASKFISYDQ